MHSSGYLGDNFRREELVIALVVGLVFLMAYPHNSVYPDEASNLVLGKQLASGTYSVDYLHRPPLLPFLAAIMFSLGAGVQTARLLLTFLIFEATIISFFRFTKEFYGKKFSRMATVALLAFPYLWRWGIRFTSDTLLMLLTILTFTFYFRMDKDDLNIISLGIVCALGMMTKMTFSILVIALLVHQFRNLPKLMGKKSTFIAAITFIGLLLGSYLIIESIYSGSSHDQLGKVISHITDREQSVIMQLLTGAEHTSAKQFAYLLLFPLILFAPLGLMKSGKNEKSMLLHAAFLISFLVVLWVVRVRYLSPLFPLIVILSISGYRTLKRPAVRWIFIVFLLFSFSMSVFYLQLDQDMRIGSDDARFAVQSLPPGVIATDYLPDYLRLTGRQIISIPHELDAQGRRISSGIDDDWLSENEVSFVMISAYTDYERVDSPEYFIPSLGPIEVGFMERPYSNGRIPASYEFKSNLYELLESNYNRQTTSSLDDEKFIVYSLPKS